MTKLPPSADFCHDRRSIAKDPKTRLALAHCRRHFRHEVGGSNNVSRSTAYRWAEEPEVKAAPIRFAAVPSIGPSAGWPSVSRGLPMGIVKLADTANSESVRLSALRAIYSEMMAVSKFAGPGRPHDPDRGAAP